MRAQRIPMIDDQPPGTREVGGSSSRYSMTNGSPAVIAEYCTADGSHMV
jgi:hypothetical protein